MKLYYLALFGVIVAMSGMIVSWYLGSMLSQPVPGKIGPPPETLPAESITIPSASGSLLSGWFVPAPAEHAAILLLHGVRASRIDLLERAIFLHRAGYSVLLFDFQAHGESPGERITFGHLEAKDTEAAFAYLRERVPDKPIGVVGVSLGGASTLLSSVPQQADAIVLEAVYTKFRDATANRIAIRLGALGHYLTPFLLWQVKPRLGFDPYRLNPIEHIATVRAPLLIVAGSEDQHTTLAESQTLFEQAPQPKTFWLVDGATHEDFHQYAPEQYQQQVLTFFQRYLREQ